MTVTVGPYLSVVKIVVTPCGIADVVDPGPSPMVNVESDGVGVAYWNELVGHIVGSQLELAAGVKA